MKWNVRHSCGLVFLILCAATFAFLHQFTLPPESAQYVELRSAVHILPDGTEEPFEIEGYDTAPKALDGSAYRFTAQLPEAPEAGYLLFETSGLEIVLWLDGAEIYRSTAASSEELLNLGQAHVPLPEDSAGRELALLCRPTGGNALFPPLLRITSDSILETDAMAYANLNGIPAGAYGFAFVLVCGLFLLSIAWKRPDWSLIPLALAALGLLLHPIAKSSGYFFLPGSLHLALAWNGFYLLILLALAVYLLMNRRRDFWRLFAWAAAGSAAALLILYLISLGRGSYLSGYINGEIRSLFQYGDYVELAYWLTFWLVAVCTLLSAYALMRRVAQIQTDAGTLAMREQLALESYRQMERKLRETAQLRHEMKHQLTALDALYRKGNTEELGTELERLTKNYAAGEPAVYTVNFTINAILQNTAAQAAAAGVRFEAVALTPEELPLPESDLCSFMMNLLENAVEANRLVKDISRRFLRFRVELNGNFLVFRCENACEASLELNKDGLPKTTKEGPEAHGFGMRQMQQIAERYGSILDFSCTGSTFTVQTALCLSES